MLSYIKQGDKHMTSNEFEAWLEKVTYCSPRMVYKIGCCRYCGAELTIGEVDICDGCFDSEQVRI